MREGQKRNTARALRRNATDAEQTMWRLLRDRRLAGIKFRRQVPIGPYVADFASIAHRLVVELDGGQHAENSYDIRRDAFLASEGWRVLRFWNNDVMRNREGVLESIAQVVGPPPRGPNDPAPHNPPPGGANRPPPPSPASGRGKRSRADEGKLRCYPLASRMARSEIFDHAPTRSRKAR
jgi:very-short-patch-repair endonuclease